MALSFSAALVSLRTNVRGSADNITRPSLETLVYPLPKNFPHSLITTAYRPISNHASTMCRLYPYPFLGTRRKGCRRRMACHIRATIDNRTISVSPSLHVDGLVSNQKKKLINGRFLTHQCAHTCLSIFHTLILSR
jgi:hypothetical protein